MTMECRDPMAAGTDAYASRSIRSSEHLVSLSLNFLLLVLDVRNHVTNNVHPSDTGIPGPRNRLHRRNNDTIEIEHLVQRLQRDSQYGRRTVRAGDNEAITSLMSLCRHHQSSV